MTNGSYKGGRDPSPASQEFLTKWFLHGRGMTMEAFCEAYGYKVSTYQNWREKVRGFARDVDRIQLRREGGEDVVFGLRDEENLFLRHYKETGSKTYALSQVNWTGQDYNKAIRRHQFAQELESVTRELMLQVEDEVFQKAKSGSLGHQKMFLEQAAPEKYATKKTGGTGSTPAPVGSKEVQQRRAGHWGAVFGAAAKRAPTAQEPDDSDLPADLGQLATN